MKMMLAVCALFVLTPGASMHAQSAPSGAAPAATIPVRPHLTGRKPIPVVRPPASLIPAPINRLSTAERMALANDKPVLHEMPVSMPTSGAALSRAGTASTLAVAGTVLQPARTHWLLLYRDEKCLPCDRLMNVLADSASPDLNGGAALVVMVAGETNLASETVRANYNKLSSATWLTDTDGQMFQTLKPHGSPTLYAMDGTRIMWMVPGNLGDPRRVEQMVSAWLATEPTAKELAARPAIPPARAASLPATGTAPAGKTAKVPGPVH